MKPFQKKLTSLTLLSVALMAFVNPQEDDKNKLYLPDDLEATLWAEAPMFYNPTNMDIDSKGRIWITEAVDYRNFNTKPEERLNNDKKGDRVMILEDSDGDGKADKSKVFVQDKDLVAPLGIAVIGKKIIVSCSPNLIVFTDENGDDIPDKKEILLTGFGGLDHDHALHSVIAGPDGNWLFNTGNAGPHIVTDKSGWTLRSGSSYTGGTPYNKENKPNQKSDDGRVWVGGLALKITPEGNDLRVVGHNFRNSYEICYDSYGNMWQNDNDDQVITCRTSYLMEGGNAGYFSADGTRFWQADRRPDQDMFTAHWHQEDPGVQPAIDNTGAGSPTGIVYYEGNQLGSKYQGTLISCEAGRNVLFSYQPKPKGAGFEMKRTNFISSFDKTDDNYIWNDTGSDTRKWFRPSDVAVGTDGALYIADWYDPIVGGHAMQDKKGYGRIYRITPKGKHLKTPKIDLTSTEGQIEALKNPAINVRNLGFEALKNQGEKVVPEVEKLLQDDSPFVRARAIWLLSKMGKNGIVKVIQQVDNQEVNARIVAFRALRQSTENWLLVAEKLSQDLSPAVRREVAISLRDVPFEQSKSIIENLVKACDGTDKFELESLGQALDGKENLYYDSIKKILPKDPSFWSEATASLLWRIHPIGAVEGLKLRANSVTISEKSRKQAITALAFVKNKSAALAMINLSKSSLKDVSEQAFWWINFRKTNDWADLLNWEVASKNSLLPIQKKMLAYQSQLLNTKLPVKIRKKAAEEMAYDPTGGKMLLSLASENKVPKDMRIVIENHIFNNQDRSIRMMAGDYFKRVSGGGLSVNVASQMTADEVKGKEIFTKNCSTCHKFGKEGAEIGPDLTMISKKFDKMGLLDAVVNPSASMAFGYEPWILTTKDKETFYGFIIGQGNTITLKDANGQIHAIKAKNIATKKQLTNSLMPDPSSMGLKEKDISDLAGYLLNLLMNE